MKRADQGSVVIWMLGLSMMLLLFGGLALDYWRGLALQRELASVAESAAIAAASGIDEEVYRGEGLVLLHESRSRHLALEAVAWQGVDVLDVDVDVAPTTVTVTITAAVELGLLGVFVDESDPFLVRATATAVPQLTP